MKKAKNEKRKTKSARLKCAALIVIVMTLSAVDAEAAKTSFARAERLFLEGRYGLAVHEIDGLIDAGSSQRDELYYIKGLSELKLNRFNEARQSFDRIVSNYPRSKRIFEAYLGKGDSYLLEGDPDRALEIYTGMSGDFANDKNMPLVRSRMGNCYTKLGLADKASYYFDKVKKEAPLSFEAKAAPVDAGLVAAGSIARPTVGVTRGTLVKPEPRQAEYEEVIMAGRNISVQVGCFKNKRNADKLAKSLSKAGYHSYVEIPVNSKDRLYRVKAGKVGSRLEAGLLASRLKADGYSTKICSDDACE